MDSWFNNHCVSTLAKTSYTISPSVDSRMPYGICYPPYIPIAESRGFTALFIMVAVVGLEPTRYFYRWILNPLCFPISPYRQNIWPSYFKNRRLTMKYNLTMYLLYHMNFRMSIVVDEKFYFFVKKFLKN